ncbi:pirin-like C-terminal cupin domain-containing protein [Herbaspirillum sp. GCM10030257]|uniref:pirin-like C-terminal cupin domain-containing protein n=1 Tax=Herbaspirillum sp. GCM10030257 TaxID=3273393 RepID=UPI0036165011
MTVHVVAGQFGDTTGAMQSLTDATMQAIDLKAGGSVTLPAPAGRAVFLYVVEGTVDIGDEKVEQYTRVEFDQSGDEITLTATDTAHVIYGHAPLIEEPVTARGPFVMTTHEEVVQAARDFQAGRFK